MRRTDLATLISGLAVVALGTVLLLDAAGTLTLDLGTLAPLALAVVGLILLVGGLAQGGAEREGVPDG